MSKKKYSYMERLGATLYGVNRLNTYAGHINTLDRQYMDVLRDMCK